MHRTGYRVTEDKPRSKHAAKHDDSDKGHRNTLAAVLSAWGRTPDANLALRLGWQRGGGDVAPTNLITFDADGAKADAWFRARLKEAGILDKTPRCTHPDGQGGKYVLQVRYTVSTARLVVPGCANAGHDGLELLAGGRKATVYPSIHPEGGQYVWDVPLPDSPCDIPLCPDAILDMPRVETVVGDAVLGEDMIVRTSSGESRTVAEWRDWMISTGTKKVGSCYVPADLRGGVEDAKHTGFLSLCRGGDSLMLHDSASAQTYWDGVRTVSRGPAGGARKDDLDTSQFDTVLDAMTVGKCKHRECRRNEKKHYLDPHLLHPWWKEARMIAIRGPIGVGKTTMIGSMLRDMTTKLGRPVKALVISHRRSLVTHSVQAYSLTTDYRNVQNWRQVPISDLESLGICLDSLDLGRSGKLAGRLTYSNPSTWQPQSIQWDVVILDESESIFRHLHSVEDSMRSYLALRSILRAHTGLTVLADAHLSDYSVGEYRRMVGQIGRHVLVPARPREGNPPPGVPASEWMYPPIIRGDILIDDRRKRSTLQDITLSRLQSPEDVDALALELAKAGRPFYLHCTARAEARRLARKLRRKHPGKLWPLVTGEHDDPDGEAFLADPNGWVVAHADSVGGVIYTRAIESGVSITEPLDARRGYDTVLVKASGEHSTWQDLVQAVGRPRHTRYIFGHVADHGRAPWWSADEYAQALQEGRAWTDGLLLASNLVDGEVIREPRDSEHAASHVATVIHECKHRRNLGEDWWSYWQEQGYAVRDVILLDDAKRKKLRERAKVEREALKVEDATSLAAAENDGQTPEEARQVLDRDSTPAERQAATKTMMEEFYEREATADLALFDDRGRGRARVRALTDLRLVAESEVEKVASIEFDAKGQTAKRHHRALAAMLTWTILRALGVRRGHLDGTDTSTTLDPANLLVLHDWLSKPDVRRVCKLALGTDPGGYLAGCQGRRKRRVTGGSFSKENSPPVTPADHDAALTDDEIAVLLGGVTGGAVLGGTDGGVTGGSFSKENTPPVTPADPDLADVDWDAVAAAPAPAAPDPMGRIAGHQLWGFAQVVARRVGLRFVGAQVRGPGSRRTRTYSLDVASVTKMLDLGAPEWARRHAGLQAPSSTWRKAVPLPNTDDEAALEAAVKELEDGLDVA